MSFGYIDDGIFSNIANAIRSKLGVANNYYPSDMPNAINSISGGGSNLGTKTVTSNGLYNASDDSLDGYSQVNVQVPVTSYNSAPLSVVANGVYNASDNGLDGFNSVTVAVPLMYLNVTRHIDGEDYFDMFDCLRSDDANFNIPVKFTDYCLTSSGMFDHFYNFNSPVILDSSVVACGNTFTYCNSFGQNVFINNAAIEYTHKLFNSCNNSLQKNVWCNNLTNFLGTTSSDSITGTTITWTPITNGYYNSTYNIYLYNNYSEETGVIP